MYKPRSKNVLPNSLRICLVDPNIAQTWAQRILPDGTIAGEVKKGDTINHTSSQPIANGLFCQRIFGPCIDYTCACGQTKINVHTNIHVSPKVCPDCHVEWTESSVRRHRLGFIQLISPVTHKWFAHSGSAYIPALMGTTVKTFKAIRDCRLFFPFSLPNRDKQNPLHSISYIEESKNKSRYLLLRAKSLNAYRHAVYLALRLPAPQGKRQLRSKKEARHADSKSSTEKLAIKNPLALQEPASSVVGDPPCDGKQVVDSFAPASFLPFLPFASVASQEATEAKKQQKAVLLFAFCFARSKQLRRFAKQFCEATASCFAEQFCLAEQLLASQSKTASFASFEAKELLRKKELQRKKGKNNSQKTEAKAQHMKEAPMLISVRAMHKILTEADKNDIQFLHLAKQVVTSFALLASFASWEAKEASKAKETKEASKAKAKQLLANFLPFFPFALQEAVASFLPSDYFALPFASQEASSCVAKLPFIPFASFAPFTSFASQEAKEAKEAKKKQEVKSSFLLRNNLLLAEQELKQAKQTRQNAKEFNSEVTTIGFNGYHSFPVRPSFAIFEDYRRPFVKYFGNTGTSSIAKTQLMAIPISRYTGQSNNATLVSIGKSAHLTSNKLKPKENNKPSPVNKYNCIVRGPEFPVKSYFSEINSAAKEQTIKRILSQTGGGGVQKYLDLLDLGYLVALLKNDLEEILPHLDRYKYTKFILCNALNRTSIDLVKTINLLDQLQTNYSATVKKLSSSGKPIPTGSELFKKIVRLEDNYDCGKAEYKAAIKFYKILEKRKTAHKRRYKLAFQLWRTLSHPTGLTMSSVPILPPALRPIIDVPKVGPIASDLNLRYRKLVFALRNLRDLSYVDFRITGAAQTSIQDAVDDILYTGGKRKTVLKTQSGKNSSTYKSIAMGLKGKHGRFRGNLLGKRVDYSGRSVIVVGPTLAVHQCGLPFELAIKLLYPFLIRRLIQKGFCKNVYSAKKRLGKCELNPQLWALCKAEMLEHLVVLNRAPTLHRLGVQAFMPVLISGRAILLHPLVCTAFNADFDGDQMAVHIPLFPQAKAEAWKMMWSRNNFLAPSSGDPILLPSQDMVLGCYYLTESILEPLQKNFSILRSNTGVNLLHSKMINELPVLPFDLLASFASQEAKSSGLFFASQEAGLLLAKQNSLLLALRLLRKRQKARQKQANYSVNQAKEPVSLIKQQKNLLDRNTLAKQTKEIEQNRTVKYYELESRLLQKSVPLILTVRGALDCYARGIYNLHSIVWVSPKGLLDGNFKALTESPLFTTPMLSDASFASFALPCGAVASQKQEAKDAKAEQKGKKEQEEFQPTLTSISKATRSPSRKIKSLLSGNKIEQSNHIASEHPIANKSYNGIVGLEGDGSSAPTLELRISPYGITRLFQTTGSKKRNFDGSVLLPLFCVFFAPVPDAPIALWQKQVASQKLQEKKNNQIKNQAIQSSSFEIASIRTTVGRLLFHELLQKF